MARLLLGALLLVSLVVSAAALPCSVRPSPDTPTAALPRLAHISQAAAQHAALRRLPAPSKQVAHRTLEIEHGCLVYAFDILIVGKRGVEEILVDAGTGKILSHKHESPKHEAAEQAHDNAAIQKRP